MIQGLMIFIILIGNVARSADLTSQASASVINAETASNKFKSSLSLDYISNLRKSSSPDKDDSTRVVFVPVYYFSDKANLEGRIDFIQQFKDEERSSLSNALLVLTPTTFDFSNQFKIKPKLSIVLPTDEEAREDQSYQGSITLRPTLEYSPSVVRGLALANIVFINKNFHQYKTQSDYTANIEYSIRNRFVVGYELNRLWYVELVNDYVRSWTYNGYARDSFYFGQSVSYEFVREWSLNMSHQNEGSVRGPNNNGENVEVFDEKTSYVSMGVSHVF